MYLFEIVTLFLYNEFVACYLTWHIFPPKSRCLDEIQDCLKHWYRQTNDVPIESNLIKVRSLFTLSQWGSENSHLLIVFSANYIDQCPRRNENVTFLSTQFKLRYLIGQNHDAICKLQSSYKVYVNTISNGEFSDPVCYSVNRDLTLIRFLVYIHHLFAYIDA